MKVGAFTVCLIASLFLAQPTRAQNTVMEPRDLTYRLTEPNPTVGRAKTASAAAKVASSLASWVNELGVSTAVERALRDRDGVIREMLDQTGQPGILVRVDIERVDGETPYYALVGSDIAVVGAGTSPVAVNLAASQGAQIRAAPSEGAVVDPDRSYFLWFSKDGSNLSATTIPARNVVSETARVFADQKLMEAANKFNEARAQEAAVNAAIRSVKDKALKHRLEELQQKQLETDKKVQSIDQELANELERVKRAQRAGGALAMLAKVLTLSSQAITLKESLGKDAPPSIDKAKSSAELQEIAKGIVDAGNGKLKRLEAERGTYIDQGNGLRRDYMKIVIETKYPAHQVPELRKY